jgi:NDP-sugar pyrophosphorylase family protein
VYCTASIAELLDCHQKHGAVATLAVMQRDSRRGLFFNNSMQLVGWTEDRNQPVATPEASTLYAFSGISICSHELFSHMDNQTKFSIIEPFLAAARATGQVYGKLIKADDWIDIGTPENLSALQKKLAP